MTDSKIIEQSIAELIPSKEVKGGGELVTSGVAFEYVSGIASERGLKTVGIVRAFVDGDEGENISTPIVVDSKSEDNLYVLTQDGDNIVASREQLVSLRTAINMAIGE